jgi:hypothetical protein
MLVVIALRSSRKTVLNAVVKRAALILMSLHVLCQTCAFVISVLLAVLVVFSNENRPRKKKEISKWRVRIAVKLQQSTI